jgi:hypothetical protein
MKKNMGNVDKTIRLLIAVVISILFLTEIISGTLGIILVSISAILLITSLINFCPLYALFGISTCAKK